MESIGKYTIIEELGSGGMAEVFKVSQNGDIYALKLLKKNMASTPGIIERFNKEAEMLLSLQHPNIVKIVETFRFNDQPAIVMEYLDGTDLKQFIINNNPVSMQDVINIFYQIMDAIRFAHHKGITHRDIKPENVIITSDKKIKLIDFGIAKIKNQYYTQTGQFLGSIVYSSPEQLNNSADIDYRSDIYSLGVFLYYLIEGKIPYESLSLSEIITNINSKDLPRLTRLTEFQPFIDKANSKDKDKRFQTIEELMLTIDLYLSPDNYKKMPYADKIKIFRDLFDKNTNSKIEGTPDFIIRKKIRENIDAQKIKKTIHFTEKEAYGQKYKVGGEKYYITKETEAELIRINKTFSPRGRITGAWLFLINLIFGVINSVAKFSLGVIDLNIILLILQLILSIIQLMFITKRLHDLSFPIGLVYTSNIGYFILVFVALVLIITQISTNFGIFLLVTALVLSFTIFFVKGSEGINRFGIDPHLRKIKVVSDEEYQNM